MKNMKKLFNASFEQSIKLLDDQLIIYMIEKGDPKSLRSRPILNTFFSIVIFSIIYLISRLFYHQDPNSPVGRAEINFFPSWLVAIFLFLWLLCIVFIKRFVYKEISQVVFLLNANNLLIIMLLSANLLCITFFLKPLTLIGLTVLLGLVLLVSCVIFINKKRSIEYVLYGTGRKKDMLAMLVEKAIKYGWIVVIVVMVWKIVFPDSDEVRTDFVGFISTLGLWIAMNIVMIFGEAYLFFPYLLHGYYKHKYSEEYRNFEGKTQLEWYGEKYFNKHIKGTDKEEIYNE
ncbi:hypothetical protein IGK08_002609 [Enterococcus sp. DIV1286c]